MRNAISRLRKFSDCAEHIYCKLPMTEVEGSMIRDIHLLTMVHIIYTYGAWADYVSGSVSGIAFLNLNRRG